MTPTNLPSETVINEVCTHCWPCRRAGLWLALPSASVMSLWADSVRRCRVDIRARTGGMSLFRADPGFLGRLVADLLGFQPLPEFELTPHL